MHPLKLPLPGYSSTQEPIVDSSHSRKISMETINEDVVLDGKLVVEEQKSSISTPSSNEVSSLNQLTVTTDLIHKMSDVEEEEKMLADTSNAIWKQISTETVNEDVVLDGKLVVEEQKSSISTPSSNEVSSLNQLTVTTDLIHKMSDVEEEEKMLADTSNAIWKQISTETVNEDVVLDGKLVVEEQKSSVSTPSSNEVSSLNQLTVTTDLIHKMSDVEEEEKMLADTSNAILKQISTETINEDVVLDGKLVAEEQKSSISTPSSNEVSSLNQLTVTTDLIHKMSDVEEEEKMLADTSNAIWKQISTETINEDVVLDGKLVVEEQKSSISTPSSNEVSSLNQLTVTTDLIHKMSHVEEEEKMLADTSNAIWKQISTETINEDVVLDGKLVVEERKSSISTPGSNEVSSLNQLTVTTDLIHKMSDVEEEEKMLADTSNAIWKQISTETINEDVVLVLDEKLVVEEQKSSISTPSSNEVSSLNQLTVTTDLIHKMSDVEEEEKMLADTSNAIWKQISTETINEDVVLDGKLVVEEQKSSISTPSSNEVSSLNQLTVTTDLIHKMSDVEEEEKMLADTSNAIWKQISTETINEDVVLDGKLVVEEQKSSISTPSSNEVSSLNQLTVTTDLIHKMSHVEEEEKMLADTPNGDGIFSELEKTSVNTNFTETDSGIDDDVVLAGLNSLCVPAFEVSDSEGVGSCDVSHEPQEIFFPGFPSPVYMSKNVDFTVNVNLPENLNISSASSLNLTFPLNDSGVAIEKSMDIIDSDISDCEEDPDSALHVLLPEADKENLDENANQLADKDNKKEKITNAEIKKPMRPCVFCNMPQTRLKRHILTRHKKHDLVSPLLCLSAKEQDRIIDTFRKQGIRQYNLEVLKTGKQVFTRERKSNNKELPVMCSGCKGFFAKSYKARHQLICPAKGTNFMIPVISIDSSVAAQVHSDDFKSILNTLRLDESTKR